MVFLQSGRARLGPSELKRTCAVWPCLTLRGGTTFWGSVEKKFFSNFGNFFLSVLSYADKKTLKSYIGTGGLVSSVDASEGTGESVSPVRQTYGSRVICKRPGVLLKKFVRFFGRAARLLIRIERCFLRRRRR